MNSGGTTTRGSYPNNQKNISLHCTARDLTYPFFRYDNANSKSTVINAVFKDANLDSISIVHTLYYSDKKEVEGSEAQNHAAMGIKFAEDGLGSDPFSAHYSKQDDAMSMTLFAQSDELTAKARKYFLIEDNASTNLSVSALTSIYQKQNFTCTKE